MIKLRTVCQAAIRLLIALTLVFSLLLNTASPARASTVIDIPGPTGSGAFGAVTLLPNGNFVVVDTGYDAGATLDVGAVYLYNGATGAQISALTGTSTADQIGRGGVVVLSNGNYLVFSPDWDNGLAAGAGAVTWGSKTTGVNGVLGAANSLVGSNAGDQVGYDNGSTGYLELPNGHYVITSPNWDNGAATNAGAVTWGSGTSGVQGIVSAANSLVGSTANDLAGQSGLYSGVASLSNGNYVVMSPAWDRTDTNPDVLDAGAVTWGNGTVGVKGLIGPGNSLVGSNDNDAVGSGALTGSIQELADGNYVVLSPAWDSYRGAASWGSGTAGVRGAITTTNSLLGTIWGDWVGLSVTPLPNGSYLVESPGWNHDAGAVTWVPANGGLVGYISATNSLVGSSQFDNVGVYQGTSAVTVLDNGNYVVASSAWDNTAAGALDAGAVTWGGMTGGVSGEISAANSLIGSHANDQVGKFNAGLYGVVRLTNGNYVVLSPNWSNGSAAAAGAVTWGNGTTGVKGTVSAANSLIGSHANDRVGYNVIMFGMVHLSNGDYAVFSPDWDNGGLADAGAVTFCSGTSAQVGIIDSANSLIGASAGNRVGDAGNNPIVTELSNGDYVVSSPYWDVPAGAANVGAVTWLDGSGPLAGVVTAANSLVGSTAEDRVGDPFVLALGNGNYVISSNNWDSATGVVDVGAVTWMAGGQASAAVVGEDNSLIGSRANDQVGYHRTSTGVIELPNHSYLVLSSSWDNGAAWDAGAVTWGSAAGGVTGQVSAANSLVGSASQDWVAYDGIVTLRNGNYVVPSPSWQNVGAVTWGSMNGGVHGTISAANSLIGTDIGLVGDHVLELANSNYVVINLFWPNGSVLNAGSITWGSGASGVSGVVGPTNSLVGSSQDDWGDGYGHASFQIARLDNGNFVSFAPGWDNGSVVDAGAILVSTGDACGNSPAKGTLVQAGAVLGTVADGGPQMSYVYDPVYQQLVIGRPAENRITLLAADDRDADCVSDTIENGAPNGGDGNNDGLPDFRQGNVASTPNAANGDYLTLATNASVQISELRTQSWGAGFPIGLGGFRLLLPVYSPVVSATVALLLEKPITFDRYWRFGPEAGNTTNHWYRFDPPVGTPLTGAQIVSSTRVNLTLVDGERGDDDLLANGIILDWGGPGSGSGAPTAVNLARLTAQTPESPRVNLGVLIVLAGLSGVVIWRRARRSRAAVP